MQNRKRDTDVQNRLLDSVGEGEGGMFRGYIWFYKFFALYPNVLCLFLGMCIKLKR